MDIGQAFTLFRVGTIEGAHISQTLEGNGGWGMELLPNRDLPAHISTTMETARGGTKIYKTIEAAVKDLQTIGLTQALLTFLPKNQ